MKHLKKLFITFSLFFMLASLTGCKKASEKHGTDFAIGICQLVQHDALDAATKGFKDRINELFNAAGKTVYIDEENASGQNETCTTIVKKFVGEKFDLIMANATAPLQAAAGATKTIPVLGTSITEYGTALGIENFTGVVGSNVSGTSDLADLKEQAKMFKEWTPNAKKIGIIYCSSEANSIYQINTIKKHLEDEGFEVEEKSFSDSNDLQSVCNALASSVDAMYVPTDNTCASNASIINGVFKAKKIPVICGEENIMMGCGIATISISYEGIGRKTAEMAFDILVNGKDVKQMEIQYDANPVKKYNASLCQEIGIVNIPVEYVAA